MPSQVIFNISVIDASSRDVWLESVMRSKADTPRLLILSGSDRTPLMRRV